jgi:hypothetical protein
MTQEVAGKGTIPQSHDLECSFRRTSQIKELGWFCLKIGYLKLDHRFSSSNAVVSRVVCSFSDHMISSQEEKTSIARMI